MSNIVIYGKGKTGQNLRKLLQKQGLESVFYDDDSGFDGDGKFCSDTTVYISPGVKPSAQGVLLAQKSSSHIVGELDYCFSLCKGKCVSVTGTNGKTTTCEMIYHILKNVGQRAFLLGNGGVPFSSAVSDIEENDVAVLESSSFQLQFCKVFAPYVSVFTNFACDHLNYHGTMDEYANAKLQNFKRQKTGYAIFNSDDKSVMDFSEQCACSKLTYSLCDTAANCYLQDEKVALNFGRIAERADAGCVKDFAMHNVSNALAAILACACFGVSAQAAVNALSSYVFLPHRLQNVATIERVRFVDDSKATNVHATLSALNCFPDANVALILGGSDKGERFDDIFNVERQNLVKVVCAGETANYIKQCAKRYGVDVEICSDIAAATRSCFECLRDIGGVVLMSNACASFDAFRGYAQRGDYFQKVVGELYESEKKF